MTTGTEKRPISLAERRPRLEAADTALILGLIGGLLALGWVFPQGEGPALLALVGGAVGGAVLGRFLHQPLTGLAGSPLQRLPTRLAGLLGAAAGASVGLLFSWSAFFGGAAAGGLLGVLLTEHSRTQARSEEA
jgi:hypothetical protein